MTYKYTYQVIRQMNLTVEIYDGLWPRSSL